MMDRIGGTNVSGKAPNSANETEAPSSQGPKVVDSFARTEDCGCGSEVAKAAADEAISFAGNFAFEGSLAVTQARVTEIATTAERMRELRDAGYTIHRTPNPRYFRCVKFEEAVAPADVLEGIREELEGQALRFGEVRAEPELKVDAPMLKVWRMVQDIETPQGSFDEYEFQVLDGVKKIARIDEMGSVEFSFVVGAEGLSKVIDKRVREHDFRWTNYLVHASFRQ